MIDSGLRLKSYHDILRGIGARARALRLHRALRQDELALRAGVGVATVIRFERNGRVALESALRIATALDADAMFSKLFEAPAFGSLDEVLEETDSAAPRPRRAPRRQLAATISKPTARAPAKKPAPKKKPR